MEDSWDFPTTKWSYPLSNCRSESILPRPRLPSASISSDDSAANVPQTNPTINVPSTSYLFDVPVRKQVSPGVWTDGTHIVYSAALPEVQRLLANARSTLTLPPPPSELVFTLAALEVFYKPGDPVHWMFWSDEQKNTTADVVNRISLHFPPLIRSSVAWNGKQEYLSILANHHGSSWRQLFENEPWFPILVPPKPTTPPRHFSLRKRKVQPGAFREPSRSPGVESDGETQSRGASPDPAAEEAELPSRKAAGKRPVRSRASRTKPKKATTPPTSSPNSPILDDLTMSPEEDLNMLPDGPDEHVEPATSRRKRKISPPSRYPQSVATSSKESSSSQGVETSLLLSATSNLLQHDETTAMSHSRNRSTSTDSSSKTVVSSNVSRGTSVSSGLTVVDSGMDAPSSSKKRKAAEAPDEEETEALRKASEEDSMEIDAEEGEDDTVATRSRNTRFKKKARDTSVDDKAEVAEKLKSRATARATTRKRARRA